MVRQLTGSNCSSCCRYRLDALATALRGWLAAAFFGCRAGRVLPCLTAASPATLPSGLLSCPTLPQGDRGGVAGHLPAVLRYLRYHNRWERIRQQVERDPALRGFLEGCSDKTTAQVRAGRR